MERGIIMSAPMVKAILEGRKTMTRRVCRKQGGSFLGYIRERMTYWFKAEPRSFEIKCPYGQPGDKLWVRETWRVVGWHEGEPLLIEYKDGFRQEECSEEEEWYFRMIEQCSDDCEKAGELLDENGIYKCEQGVPTRWRPSIHMPRWASRITLEITNVRVERVQEITPADCIAEGSENDLPMWRSFSMLWDSLHKKENQWVDNPFVWVIEFRRV